MHRAATEEVAGSWNGSRLSVAHFAVVGLAAQVPILGCSFVHTWGVVNFAHLDGFVL